uniref:Uncharacterized protein n=1 Tax=Sphaerodactylus townsendi TaxID=933632 RepID=A0ACB8ENN7_9SAUR
MCVCVCLGCDFTQLLIMLKDPRVSSSSECRLVFFLAGRLLVSEQTGEVGSQETSLLSPSFATWLTSAMLIRSNHLESILCTRKGGGGTTCLNDLGEGRETALKIERLQPCMSNR